MGSQTYPKGEPPYIVGTILDEALQISAKNKKLAFFSVFQYEKGINNGRFSFKHTQKGRFLSKYNLQNIKSYI